MRTKHEHPDLQSLRNPLVVIPAVVLLPVLALLSGCAVGRDDAGAVILGIKAGSFPESIGQGLHAAADLLPPPFNYLAGAFASLLISGGTAVIARRQAEEARRRENEAWDEAQLRAQTSPPPIREQPPQVRQP